MVSDGVGLDFGCPLFGVEQCLLDLGVGMGSGRLIPHVDLAGFEQLDSMLELLELLGRAGLPAEPSIRRVSTYSKGMRQKVGIALALATEAPLHGWAIIKRIKEMTEGRTAPSSGSLYLAMVRLEERGLLEQG